MLPPIDLDSEIARAELMVEALRSHQRLEAIEAEYHAKLHEYCMKRDDEFALRELALRVQIQKLADDFARLGKRFHARGRRMLRLQGKLTAARSKR